MSLAVKFATNLVKSVFLKSFVFFCTYFFADLKPVFTVSPRYIGGAIKECQYTSILSLNTKSTFYLTINGKRRDFPGEFSAEYKIQSYDDVGEARCVLYDPLRMKSPVLSNATTVTVKGRNLFVLVRYKIIMFIKFIFTLYKNNVSSVEKSGRYVYIKP